MTDRKRAALGAALRSMFGRLEARGVPEHLRAVVEQLDDGDGEPQPEGSKPSPAASSPPAPPRR